MMISVIAALVLAPDAPAVEAKVVGASLFKNGYAVVIREADMPANGQLLVKDPPNSSLGTLWVSASSGVKINEVVWAGTEKELKHNPGSIDDLLAANVGKRLTLVVTKSSDDAPTQITGKLISCDGQIAMVETDAGVVALGKAGITRVTATGKDMETKVTSKYTEHVLRVKGSGTGKVFLASLERGLTWAPAYQVDISDEKKLSITAKATILDDRVDLKDIELRLITGFPNVQFVNIADPLTSGQGVDAFVNSLMQGGISVQSSSLASQMASNSYRGERFDAPMGSNGDAFTPFTPSSLEGIQAEDLFFYRQPGVTLKAGEKGYYVLFQAQSEYQHLYVLDIADTSTAWSGARSSYVPTPNPGSGLDVWHTLTFKNTAKLPFTTGPGVTVKDGAVLGQDTLMYTTPGDEAMLRITKALDIRAEQLEEEQARERGALKGTYGPPNYDLVTVNGTVELVNGKDKPVKLRITKWISGEGLSATSNGVITKTAKGLRAVNPTSKVVWNPTLKPGETLKLTYTYKVYVTSI